MLTWTRFDGCDTTGPSDLDERFSIGFVRRLQKAFVERQGVEGWSRPAVRSEFLGRYRRY